MHLIRQNAAYVIKDPENALMDAVDRSTSKLTRSNRECASVGRSRCIVTSCGLIPSSSDRTPAVRPQSVMTSAPDGLLLAVRRGAIWILTFARQRDKLECREALRRKEAQKYETILPVLCLEYKTCRVGDGHF